MLSTREVTGLKYTQQKWKGLASHKPLYDIISTALGDLRITYIPGEHSVAVLLTVEFLLSRESGAKEDLALKKQALPEKIRRQFNRYISGKRRNFDIPVRIEGTDFDKRVWQTMKDIPYGETRTYKWVAERIGLPGGIRAVGRALSRNPLPIILPCHRVIQSDGGLGYSSGVEIKRRLLEIEYYNSL